MVVTERKTKEVRREEILDAAFQVFAERGFHGASTEEIARRAGISQPYVFRLFGTKKDLFIAAVNRGAERVAAVFSDAADGTYGQEALNAMGLAYQELLMADSELLGMQLQQFAACHDPEVQRAVRGSMQRIWAVVENVSGAPLEDRVTFLPSPLPPASACQQGPYVSVTGFCKVPVFGGNDAQWRNCEDSVLYRDQRGNFHMIFDEQNSHNTPQSVSAAGRASFHRTTLAIWNRLITKQQDGCQSFVSPDKNFRAQNVDLLLTKPRRCCVQSGIC